MIDDVRITLEAPDLIPERQHVGDAGADLKAAEDAVIYPGENRTIPSGVRAAIPYRYVGLVFPRSGLATKHGLRLANCVGVIDCQYRGDIGLCVYNDSDAPKIIRRGDRVAQLVIVPVELPNFEVVETLPETDRGENGFGSTGV
jgi:dUTP pyrophosphatase